MNSRNLYNPGLPERCTQASGDARTKVGFGAGVCDVHAAVEEAIDQRTDDFRAVQDFAIGRPPVAVAGEAIEMGNLPIEEHDRHL